MMSRSAMWHRLELMDHHLLLRLRELETPFLTRLMQGLTHLGDTATWSFVSLLLLAAGGEARELAIRLWVAAGVALAISQPLKRLCRRTRPALRLAGFTALVEHPDRFSFPSGHTTVAWSVAVAMASVGPAIGLVMFPLAWLIGASRVYLGAHYPLDVGVGAVLGIIAGWLARLLLA